jgi:hypothetical protein
MAHVERIRQMLKDYPENLSEMKRLEQEMTDFVPITSDEVLEMLNFPGKSDDQVKIQKQRSLNRLFYIATSYKRLTWLINHASEKEMAKDYARVAREVDFVKYGIRALPRYYRNLLTFEILEDHRWGEVCQKFHISGSELNRKKAKAVELMASTFADQHQYFGFYEEEFDNDHTGAI